MDPEDPIDPEDLEDPPQPPPPEPKKEEDELETDEPIEKFLPTGQTVSMAFWWATGTADEKDPKKDNIKCQSRTIELPTYRFKDDTAVPPTRYFYVPAGIVATNPQYNDFFISEQTIAAHLLIRSNLEKLSMRKQRITATRVFSDAEAKNEFGRQYREKKWKDGFTFSALKPDGHKADIATLTTDMRNQSDSDFARLRTWSKFITTIRRKTLVKYDVKARFWLPKLQQGKGKYRLYLLPTKPSIISGTFLEAAFTDAYNDLENNVFKIALTSMAEIKNCKLRRIGHNLFDLFDTFMSREDYLRMVKTSYSNAHGEKTYHSNPDPNVAVDPWPLRPWPSKSTKGGKAANEKLEHCERYDVRDKELNLSEMMGVSTKRTRSQAQAMGYISATEIAKIVWPKIMVTPEQIRLSPAWNCEWLHRIAHSYGGEQHQGNLLFGTSECNTDMIRTEILVRRFVMNARPGWKCRVFTVLKNELPMQVPVPVERWCEDFIRDQRPMPDPPDEYPWASPFIQYIFKVDIPGVPAKEQPPLWTMWFDTMNRYVPLRLDVDIDDILMDRFMEWMLKKYPA